MGVGVSWRPVAEVLSIALMVGCASASAQATHRTFVPVAARGLDADPTSTAATATVSAPATSTPTATPTAQPGCGLARGSVRRLADAAAADVAVLPLARTVRELREIAPLADLEADTPRLARVERSTFQMRVSMVDVVSHDDVIAVTIADPDDPSRTATVELPNAACDTAAASPRFADIAAARAAFLTTCGVVPSDATRRLYGSATIVGIGFFDPHPVMGAAPNGLGLAPVLRFQSPDCNTAGTATPTSTVTPTPTLSPTMTPTIPPTRTPVPTSTPTITPATNALSLTGSGSPTAARITLDPGTRHFGYTYTGALPMSAQLQDGNGVVLRTIGTCPASCTGSADIAVQGGDYRVKVTSGGNWAFTIQ